jgi:hypothetical protein
VKFVVEINCDHFKGQTEVNHEIMRILEKLMGYCADEGAHDQIPLRDTNGNTVGWARFVKQL